MTAREQKIEAMAAAMFGDSFEDCADEDRAAWEANAVLALDALESLAPVPSGEVETPCATCGGAKRWQCSGCCKRFDGDLMAICPNCGREGYWTGSVAPCPDCEVETPEAARAKGELTINSADQQIQTVTSTQREVETPEAAVEAGARAHHEAYEARSALIGYETRTATRVSWDQLSAEMKDLMLHAERAALKAALPHLAHGWTPPGGTPLEAEAALLRETVDTLSADVEASDQYRLRAEIAEAALAKLIDWHDAADDEYLSTAQLAIEHADIDAARGLLAGWTLPRTEDA